MLLFALVGTALLWMHVAIRGMEREVAEPELRKLPELPEMQPIHEPKHVGALGPHLIEDWRPEDPVFWNANGRAIARRNLWISIPALLLSFAVWMVWSVVVAKLPVVGFKFTTDQLFWLAALPGLSGATLRIFYSFMVPIFGGRLWTTLATWSLIIPAFGTGLAVQNPDTPYFIFLGLALLCGLGGGNFASSMANISFFFPKAEKGNALALNAGLGNLGVSVGAIRDPAYAFWGFFASFMLLFFASGVGNASTFQMIPAIMRKEVARLAPQLSSAEQVRQDDKESAAIIGFSSAVAAYGAFFIPKSYGTSIGLTGGSEAALWMFFIFYLTCIAMTWWFYSRPGGLLNDIKRGGPLMTSPDPGRA
jgi:nitrate/nitrite transporter NarK